MFFDTTLQTRLQAHLSATDVVADFWAPLGHAVWFGKDPAFDQRFREAFAGVLRETLDPAVLDERIDSDGELADGALDIAHALALRDGGAWGQGYPEPQFDGEFEVLATRVVGERHLKLELALVEPGRAGLRLNAIEFGGWNGVAPAGRIRIAYRLEPDDYRGGNAIQLVVVHREAV